MSTNLGGVRDAKQSMDSDELISNLSGILLLLMSAKFSLKMHVAGRVCVDIVEKCISTIQQQYNLPECYLCETVEATEASLDGTFRLLEYLTGELRDRLNERQMAAELQVCVDRLAGARALEVAPCAVVQ
jgi:hypothetical protein